MDLITISEEGEGLELDTGIALIEEVANSIRLTIHREFFDLF
jgi:hypothetical protein